MSNKVMKKIISMVLVFVITVSCFDTFGFISYAAANTTQYTEFTFDDAGTVTLSKTSMIEGKIAGATTLDGTAFRGKVTYMDRTDTAADASPWNDRLYVGVNNYWSYADGGLYIFYDHGTEELVVNGKRTALPTEIDSLIGKTVEYYITFDTDGTTTQAVIYIADVKIVEVSLSAIGTGIHAYSANGTMTIESAEQEFSQVTFSDAGTIDMTKTSMIEGKLANLTSMDGICFSGKVTYKDRTNTAAASAPYNDRLYIAVNNYWGYADGGLYIYYNHNANQLSVNGTNYAIPTELGSLIGKTVEFDISFDVGRLSTIAWICINDIQIAEVTMTVAPGIGIHAYSANGTMTIESVSATQEPVEYTEFTFGDAGTIDLTKASMIEGKVTKLTSMNHTAFCGKVTYKDRTNTAAASAPYNDRLYIAVNNYWGYAEGGLYIYYNHNANQLSVNGTNYVMPTELGSLIGKTVEYYITFDAVGTTTAAVIYINDMQIAEVSLAAVGTGIHAYSANGTMTIESVVAEPEGDEGGSEEEPQPEPIEQKTPEELGYTTQVILSDFDLDGGEYSSTSESGNHHFGTHSSLTTLDNTYLDVYLTFEDVANIKVENSLRYCSTSGWHGIQIGLGAEKLQIFTTRNTAAGHSYDKDALGITTLEERFNLKLGVQIGEDKGDGTCDITYDLWINDTRVVAAAVLENATVSDIGAGLGIYTPSGTIYVTSPEVEAEPIEQKTPEQLGYTQVRLRDFMLADGTYSPEHKSGNHHFDISDLTTLDSTYLDVNMSFEEPDTIAFDNSLRFASTEGWRGIQIGLTGGELKICNAADRKGESYSKEELGLATSFAESFNLKLGIQIGEDKGDGTCDITYDLWIDDVRVAAEAVLAGVSVADMGTGLGIYTPSGTMILSSPDSVNADDETIKETLPSTFRTVTFHNFGIQDGTYQYNGGKLCAYGDFALNLNKTIFSADVYFSNTKGGDFRYAGSENEWCGIWFYNRADGKLYMRGVKGDTGTYVFNSIVAGVELTDNEYNMKLSTEFVDSDNDGAKDDVKLGVWFNDVLYDNEYIYLKDYVQHFGNYAAVYVDKGEGFIRVKSDTSVEKGVDFTLFGCTKNWAKEIGL